LIGTPPGGGHGMAENSEMIGTAENIGREMFTKFVLPFEASAFLLVAAAIGALVLAKKKFQRD
jgi:NADH-quinone oxidoreductase subunit J